MASSAFTPSIVLAGIARGPRENDTQLEEQITVSLSINN